MVINDLPVARLLKLTAIILLALALSSCATLGMVKGALGLSKGASNSATVKTQFGGKQSNDVAITGKSESTKQTVEQNNGNVAGNSITKNEAKGDNITHNNEIPAFFYWITGLFLFLFGVFVPQPAWIVRHSVKNQKKLRDALNS